MFKCGECRENVKHTDEFTATSCGILAHSKCMSIWKPSHSHWCDDCYYNPEKIRKIFVSFANPAENESAKKRLKEQDAQIAALEANLARCEITIGQLQGFRTKYKSSQESKTYEISKNIELEKTKQKLEAALKERGEEIATLKKNLEDSQRQCAEFQEKMRNLRSEIVAMEKSNVEQYAKDFELQEKFNEMNKSYQKMRNQIGKNIELEEQLDKMKQNQAATLKERDEAIAALKKSLEQSHMKSGVLQEVGSLELQEQIAAMQKCLEETQNKFTELQEKVKHFNTQPEKILEGQPDYTNHGTDSEDQLMRGLDLDTINLDNNAAYSAEKPRSNLNEVTAVCSLKPEEVKNLEEAYLAYVRDEASKVNMKQGTSILKPQITNGAIIEKPESALKATPAIIKIPSADHENTAPATSQPTESKINPGVGGGAQAKAITQDIVSSPTSGAAISAPS